LYRCGALRNLISIIQEYKIDILAIQEVRWLGQNILEKKEGTIYYSYHNQTHQFGTGFMVNKNMKHLVIDFQPIDMRLCKFRLRGRFHNYSVFSAHAPTEEKEVKKIPSMKC
jgi:exonuclease III